MSYNPTANYTVAATFTLLDILHSKAPIGSPPYFNFIFDKTLGCDNAHPIKYNLDSCLYISYIVKQLLLAIIHALI